MRSRLRRSALGAFLLSLLLAGTTLALSWASPVALTTSTTATAWYGNTVGVGVAKVIVAYQDGGRVRVRRSLDSGASWLARQTLSRSTALSANGGALAASGTGVEAAWSEHGSDGKIRIVYRHSSDSGATWGAATVIATGVALAYPQVARDTLGHVVITWFEPTTGDVFVRVSGDSGTTWGSATKIGTSTYLDPGESGAYLAHPDVATANGRIVATWFAGEDHIVSRRSLDYGVTWAPLRDVATAPVSELGSVHIAANGPIFVIAFERDPSDFVAVTARSGNGGFSWEPSVGHGGSLAGSAQPEIAFRAGAFHLVYSECDDPACASPTLAYEAGTSTAASWSASEFIGPGSTGWDISMGVTASNGKVVASYLGIDDTGAEADVFAVVGGLLVP